MNKLLSYFKLSIALFLLSFLSFTAKAQESKIPFQSNPWNEEQLISPESLANLIMKKVRIKIYNIGVVENIKGAINLGAASEKENLEKLQQIAKKGDKNELVVIYCGCCPMDKCPNIKPAFKLFADQKFTNVRLLDLPVNINVNWIRKGYPLE